MRRGAPWTVERHQVAAWSLPWLRSRWQCCHRRSQPWFAKPQTPAPQQGARRVPAGRLRGRGDPGCSSAFRAVVRLLSASLLVRHGVPGGGDGVRPDTTGQAVSGRLSDRGVHCGRRTRPRGHWTGTGLADVSASSRGAGGHDGQVSVLGAAEVSRREQAHCRPVRSWPG